MRRLRISNCKFWFLPLLFAIPLLAVNPYFWEVRTYDEFQQGKFTNVSLTNDDQVILAPRFDMIFDTEQPLVWSAVADSKGTVYFGTGHDGKIYKVDAAGKGDLLADLNEIDILALAVDSKDVLYAGASPNGKVYKIAPGAQPEEFFDPKAKYIWALAFDRQGRLIVATGDQGLIFRVTADGVGAPFYDTDETHVISLAVDNDGNVIAGGDPKGYLYRISPEGKGFVLYDAGMREVHALAVAPNGRIYAAVVNGRPGFSPATSPSTSASTPGVLAPTITVTVGSTDTAAQDIQVIDASSDQPASGTPRPAVRSAEGSAQSVILEVLPDGAVNTLWRLRDEMVFSLLPQGDRLLFSTGSKGRIYALDAARKTTLLLESTEEQTTRLVQVGNRVYAGSANAGKVFRVSDVSATSGTYESAVRDTDTISKWGKIAWKAENSELIQLSTRSGNTSIPDKTWSDWAAVAADGTAASPNARFVQWKAVLNSDGTQAPALNSVTLPYMQQNFEPELTSLDVLPPGVALIKVQPLNASGVPTTANDPATNRANARAGLPPPPRVVPRRVVQRGAQSFQWTATDRNQDLLRYDVYYRGESERSWKLLKKDLEDTFYTINSDTLPDGMYVLRIVASDVASNPADGTLTGEAESRPFTIDNTPPTVTIRQEALTDGRVRVAIEAADPTSTLNQAEISVDTNEWRTFFPQDGITDSRMESFLYQSDVLQPGEHVIAFRIYDQNDNVGMGKLVVRIP